MPSGDVGIIDNNNKKACSWLGTRKNEGLGHSIREDDRPLWKVWVGAAQEVIY